MIGCCTRRTMTGDGSSGFPPQSSGSNVRRTKSRYSSTSLQPHSSCQLCLADIEGPESLRAQLQRRGDVKRVQSRKTKSSAVLSGKLDASLERQLRQRTLQPKSGCSIALEILGEYLRVVSRHFPRCKVLRDGMRPFRSMERSQPNPGMLRHHPLRFGKVPVVQVQRDEETRVGVDAQ